MTEGKNYIIDFEGLKTDELIDSNLKVYTYLIELNDGKYFIGGTTKILDAFNKNTTSLWVKKYGVKHDVPTKILMKSDPVLDALSKGVSFRTIFTIFFMRKYGIENVRGGGYSKIDLDDAARRNINSFLRNMAGKNDIEELKDAYNKVKSVNNKIFNTHRILGLQYGDLVKNVENLEDNDEFRNLNFNNHLTRSIKKRLFSNVDFVKPDDSLLKRKKRKLSVNNEAKNENDD